MNTITVDKAQLLGALESNRATHADIFQRAIEKYRARSIELFEDYIAQVKAGKPVPRTIPLPMPEEHTADYDRTIAMLQWHQYEEVELSESEFRQYVQDQWGWHQTFTANSASYMVDE